MRHKKEEEPFAEWHIMTHKQVTAAALDHSETAAKTLSWMLISCLFRRFPEPFDFLPRQDEMRMPLHLLCFSEMPRIEVRNLMACFVEFGAL